MSCDDNRDSFLESRYEHYRELGKNEKQSQELAWDDYWNERWEVPNLEGDSDDE